MIVAGIPFNLFLTWKEIRPVPHPTSRNSCPGRVLSVALTN